MVSETIQIETLVPLFGIISIQLAAIIREVDLLEETRGNEFSFGRISSYIESVPESTMIPAFERHHIIHITIQGILFQAIYTIERNAEANSVFLMSLPIGIIWLSIPLLEFDEYREIMKFREDIPRSLYIHLVGTILALVLFFFLPYRPVIAAIPAISTITITYIAFSWKLYHELTKIIIWLQAETISNPFGNEEDEGNKPKREPKDVTSL